jgi:hypothetical protein
MACWARRARAVETDVGDDWADQDSQLDPSTEMPVPIPGGRGMYMNHNPHFYADDNTLVTGVRLHSHVAYDHLTGTLVPG